MPAGEGVTVHSMDLLTDGFEGFGRALRITVAGLSQLLESSFSSVSERSGFYFSIGTEYPHDPQSKAVALVQRLLRRAAQEFNWDWEPQLRFVSAGGNTGTALALQAAVSDLRNGIHDCAIIGSVDSLLTAARLEQIEAEGRLKSEVTPSGLQPGEAGVFLR